MNEQMWERLASHFSDELVCRWHEDRLDQRPLHEYMGLSEEQYSAWAESRWADILGVSNEATR